MANGDADKEDGSPSKAPVVIDLDALSEAAESAQEAVDRAGGWKALNDQVSAAQEVIRVAGGVDHILAASERASRAIERATLGLTGRSLINDMTKLTELSATSRVFEDIERQNRLLTSGIGDSLARAAAGLPSSALSSLAENLTAGGAFTDWARSGELVRAANAIASIDLPRFYIPEVSAIGALSRDIEALIRPSFDISAPRIGEMLSGLHTPWLDTSNMLASAEAMVRVQGLGTQLQQHTAFNPDYSALLRETLGDWRDVTIVPEALEEQSARSLFYVDHGFDARAVDRPDEAFDESLTLAGIAFAPEDNELDGRHDDAGLERSRQLHAAVQRLEADLRSFIVAVLSAAYGPDWFKKLPNGLYDLWLEKQQRDPRGNIFEPIDYADFTDFERVICKRDLFPSVFAEYFGTIESARESLMRLAPPRITAMHSRPIGRDDALLAAFEIKRLMLRIPRR